MPGAAALVSRNLPLWGVIALQAVELLRERPAAPAREVVLSEQAGQVALAVCREELHTVLSCPVEVPEAKCPGPPVPVYNWLQPALASCGSAFGAFVLSVFVSALSVLDEPR